MTKQWFLPEFFLDDEVEQKVFFSLVYHHPLKIYVAWMGWLKNPDNLLMQWDVNRVIAPGVEEAAPYGPCSS